MIDSERQHILFSVTVVYAVPTILHDVFGNELFSAATSQTEHKGKGVMKAWLLEDSRYFDPEESEFVYAKNRNEARAQIDDFDSEEKYLEYVRK